MTGARVLVVEDEYLIVELLSLMLSDMGLDVCASAATADEAVALAKKHLPELVLMDVQLKGQRDGVYAAQAIRQTLAAPVIFVTGSRDPATVSRIEQSQPSAVLFKPIRFDQFKHAVEVALEGSAPQTGQR